MRPDDQQNNNEQNNNDKDQVNGGGIAIIEAAAFQSVERMRLFMESIFQTRQRELNRQDADGLNQRDTDQSEPGPGSSNTNT